MKNTWISKNQRSLSEYTRVLVIERMSEQILFSFRTPFNSDYVKTLIIPYGEKV